MSRLVICIAVAVLSAAPACLLGEDLFPDKKLEAVVRQYVFGKRNNEEPLVEKDVQTISTIHGKNAGITNLAGLEKCFALAELDLEGNAIADVSPIAGLKNLQSVNLAGNKIKDVAPLKDLTRLQYLHLAGNEVADINALAAMENMRSLYLSENQIKDISVVAKLPKIWSLYLDGNPVADLKPLSGLRFLSSVDLSGCGISNVDSLTGLTDLKHVILADNKLTDLKSLVEMAKKDAAGEMRFAPFWNLYLTGNPLSDAAKKQQIPELKKLGARVHIAE